MTDGYATADFGYDDHNRLTTYGYGPNYPRSYTYDEWGNLRSVSSGTGGGEAPNYTLSYTNNASGAPATNRIGNAGYSYDAAGNMTSDGGVSYTYDAASRLKTAGANNSCEYDGDGNKVKQVSGGYPLYYLWSSVLGEPVVELDSAGGVYRAYVQGPGGQMIAMMSYDAQFYWLHTDHLGSGRKITNSSGAVVYRGEFDPHGQVLYEWASGGATFLNSHKFTGYERDWATNLNYAKARTYNHNRGRFMQADPLGIDTADPTDPQSLNRYSYVGNDPVNFIDPSGLFMILVCGPDTGYCDSNGCTTRAGQCYILELSSVSVGPLVNPREPKEPREPREKKEKKPPCPSGKELAGNSTVRQAVDRAFTDSQFGTPSTHEEGGYIWRNRQSGRILVTRVPPGPPVSAGQLTLPAITSANTPSSPTPIHRGGYALVGTFHTHPYTQGQPVTGMPGYVYARPALPSVGDTNTAHSLGVPGLIRYQDQNGNARISLHGPARNSHC